MTNFSPAVIAAVFLVYSVPLQAQVKDTYQDQSNALTTIVVKEDSASDMDILQQQFDLDAIGMHQVIRITTRPNVAPKPEEVRIATPTAQEESIMIAQTEAQITSNETAPVIHAPTVVQAAEKGSELPVTTKGDAVTQKSQRSSSSSSSYSNRSKSSRKQSKVFNKRVKKEKRKRVSRRDNRKARCYKF
jgi:hypothetical protein